MNKAILMGRLTSDPTLKTTPANKQVTTFTLAVARRYAKDTTDFINCVAWEKTAEFICRYFSKGSMIAVDGEIQTRSYTTNDGQKRTVTEIRVDNAYFTGEKKEMANNGGFADNSVYADQISDAEFLDMRDADESDLPF